MLTHIEDDSTWRQLSNISLTNAEKSNVDLLIKAYLRYLHPETETAIMKSNFQKIKQKRGESITKFIGRIHEMAMKAYGENKAVRDDISSTRLIEGVWDDRIKFKLMERGQCSLEELTKEAIKYDRMYNSNTDRRTTVQEDVDLDILGINEPRVRSQRPNPENHSPPKIL